MTLFNIANMKNIKIRSNILAKTTPYYDDFDAAFSF